MKTGRADWDAMIRVAGIPSDEPVFLLRGQEENAAETVRDWVERARRKNAPIPILELAMRQVDAMEAWPTKKAVGVPDDLAPHDIKQLIYAHTRRVWRVSQMSREALAGALMLDLLNDIQRAGDTFALVNLKEQAAALSEVLTGGRKHG